MRYQFGSAFDDLNHLLGVLSDAFYVEETNPLATRLRTEAADENDGDHDPENDAELEVNFGDDEGDEEDDSLDDGPTFSKVHRGKSRFDDENERGAGDEGFSRKHDRKKGSHRPRHGGERRFGSEDWSRED